MKHHIRSAPLFLNYRESLRHAVEQLLESHADCILVTDDISRLVGILTTSDILNAIRLQQGRDGWDKLVLKNLMMTPFENAFYTSFIQDIKKIHSELNLSYFPILRKEQPATVHQIVGLLSLSDIGAYYLRGLKNEKSLADSL